MKTYKILYERGDIFYVQADKEIEAFKKLWEKYPGYQYADLANVKIIDKDILKEVEVIRVP